MHQRMRVLVVVLLAVFALVLVAWSAAPAPSHALATDGAIIVEN